MLLFCLDVGCDLLIAGRPVGIIIYHIISPPGLTLMRVFARGCLTEKYLLSGNKNTASVINYFQSIRLLSLRPFLESSRKFSSESASKRKTRIACVFEARTKPQPFSNKILAPSMVMTSFVCGKFFGDLLRRFRIFVRRRNRRAVRAWKMFRANRPKVRIRFYRFSTEFPEPARPRKSRRRSRKNGRRKKYARSSRPPAPRRFPSFSL